MAQAFSATLDSLFMLDSNVDQLTQTIEQKYVSVSNEIRPNTVHTKSPLDISFGLGCG
jgi:c-di-AMP phosphodiesterase-like protein